MFNDKRSKKIILAAHCIINQNSISDGTADFPGLCPQIIKILEENNLGVIQLPCPELMCLGLDRGNRDGATNDVLVENTRIRDLMEIDVNMGRLKKLAEPIVYQVEEYRKYGFEIIGIIGVNRSPSCGVETTSTGNKEQEGRGIFTDILLNELIRKDIHIKAIGIKTSSMEESIESTRQLLFE